MRRKQGATRKVLLAAVALFGLSAASARAGERLLVPQLPGWQPVFSQADPSMESAELIPPGESPADWSRRATVQAFRGAAYGVAEVLEMLAARTAALCQPSGAEIMRLGQAGGVEAGLRTIACNRYRDRDEGEYVVYYALKGRDALYLLNRAWRGPAFPAGSVPVADQELDEWKRSLRSARLCDTRDPARPCR